MNKLQELAGKYGTDKTKDCHTFANKNYMHRYEYLFSPIREEVEYFLEIGVYGGCSLRVWEEYFPNAKILGLDINPTAKVFETDRIKIFIGSQDDPDTLDAVIEECGGKLNAVIDDGSHLVEHMISSFEYLFPSVTEKGHYIIEDTSTTYRDLTAESQGWPGMHLNNCSHTNDRIKFNEWLLNKLEEIDHKTGTIDSIGLYHQQVAFRKI